MSVATLAIATYPTPSESFWSERLQYLVKPKHLASRGHCSRVSSDFEEWKAFIASSCSAVFGSRLRAAILALNAGVPAVVSNDDARAREVCTRFGIPLVAPALVRHASPGRIARFCSVEQLNARYDFCYQKFCRWLAHHGQQVVDPPSPGYPMPKIDGIPRNVARDRVRDAVRVEVSRLCETTA